MNLKVITTVLAILILAENSSAFIRDLFVWTYSNGNSFYPSNDPSTTTDASPSTVPPPNLSVCDKTGTAGSKSICYVNKASSTQAASDFCNANRMSLYKISDAASYDTLAAFITENFPGNQFIIGNGYTESAGNTNWVIFTDRTTPLYKITSWSPAFTPSTTRCLLIVIGSSRTVSAKAINCADNNYYGVPFNFVCEY